MMSEGLTIQYLTGGAMVLSLRRVCAILVVLLTLTPVLGSAAETVQERPAPGTAAPRDLHDGEGPWTG